MATVYFSESFAIYQIYTRCKTSKTGSKVRVKWSRYRPGVAQSVGRGIALLFHDRGTRRGWVVSITPWPNFTPVKEPVSLLQEAGWASGPVWTSGKSRSQTVQPVASCRMSTGSFPGVKSGWVVTLNPHPLLVPSSRKSRAIPLLSLWAVPPVQSLSACTRMNFTYFLSSSP